MNCEKGDLARIVHSHFGLEGMVVTCVAFHGRYGNSKYADLWDTDLVDPRNGSTWLVSDSNLRPIRPQSDNAEDEMLRIVGHPAKEPALVR